MQPIKKITYLNYVNSIQDGASTHVTEFVRNFSELCDAQGISFNVVSPTLKQGGHEHGNRLFSQLKFALSRYYVRDLKIMAQQVKEYYLERKLLIAQKPDLVIVRYNGRNLSILHACKSLNIPCVLEVNASDTEKPDGDYKRIPFFQRRLQNHSAINLVSGAFTVSKAIKEEIVNRCQSDAARKAMSAKISVIPNGANTSHFDGETTTSIKKELGIARSVTTIGYIGGFSPWHEVERLVDAVNKLVLDKQDVFLLLVGSDNKHSQDVKQYVKKLNLEKHVLFTGYVSYQEAPKFVGAMDIAVLPNTAYYCSPLKLFEYMSMKKAIVCVSTSPVQDIIEHEVDGLLFEQGDYGKMEEYLDFLVKNSSERIRLGAKSHEKVTTKYTWKDNSKRVMALVKRTVSNESDA